MRVVIAPGDGIGPEVLAPAVEVLRVFHPEWEYIPVHLGYECWKRTGDALSQKTLETLLGADLILLYGDQVRWNNFRMTLRHLAWLMQGGPVRW